MDFKDRLDLYLEGGMINEQDVKDVNEICNLFKSQYHVELCEENAGTFIAHLCAAYARNKTHEPVEELPIEVVDELKALDTYDESLEVLNQVMKVTQNSLNEMEQGYALLHINNLIAMLKEQKEWHN